MKKFLRENGVLILGIALPILLVIIFWLSGEIARIRTDPPTHAVVFLTNYYHYPENNYHFDVVAEKLQVKYRNLNQNHYPHHSPRLFIFDPVQGICTEYTYDIPEVTNDQWHPIHISEFENMRLDKRHVSPEGFVFENRYNSSLGLFGMFGYRHKNGFVLSKNGYHMPVPYIEPDYYATPYFIGWVSQ